jgi:hypothetical protein
LPDRRGWYPSEAKRIASNVPNAAVERPLSDSANGCSGSIREGRLRVDTSHFKPRKTNPLLSDEEGTTFGSPGLSPQWLRVDQRFDLVTEWYRAIATVLRGPIADEVNHNNVPRRAARARWRT